MRIQHSPAARILSKTRDALSTSDHAEADAAEPVARRQGFGRGIWRSSCPQLQLLFSPPRQPCHNAAEVSQMLPVQSRFAPVSGFGHPRKPREIKKLQALMFAELCTEESSVAKPGRREEKAAAAGPGACKLGPRLDLTTLQTLEASAPQT